jgi:uncharacterized protein YkwD
MGVKEVIRHLFIPHESNNHRAKALHVDALALYILAFAIFNVAIKTLHTAYPDVLGYATNIQVQELLADTNAKRALSGLAPLTLNQQLSVAAANKASDMFTKDYWAHVAPDGKTPWDFIVGVGYRYTVAGENLAKNFQDSNGVVEAWMASPSHRDNLLKPNYKEVGFAVVNGKLQGEETTLVVQMFGTKPAAVVEVLPSPSPVLPSVIPTVAVTEPVLAKAPDVKPVVIPEVASATQKAATFIPFASAVTTPKIDIVTLRRDVTMAFGGAIIGIFLIDLYIALKRKTVRAVGSSVAHVLFFLVILASMNTIIPGSVL